tara:strand:- start:28 stop:492 length:465 start_codon:yes stop_codon:yes gene_type:complete
MQKNLKKIVRKNAEILALAILIFITVISTTYFNYSKRITEENYKDLINNIYLKKTLRNFFNNLEPKYKKINHKVTSGETLNKILNDYFIKETEIIEIKRELSKKIKINKLNVNQKIRFTVDQSTNSITEFIFNVSNTEKIFLKKNLITENLNQK